MSERLRGVAPHDIPIVEERLARRQQRRQKESRKPVEHADKPFPRIITPVTPVEPERQEQGCLPRLLRWIPCLGRRRGWK